MKSKMAPHRPRTLDRSQYLRIVHAGLTVQHYRFSRQAALNWLASYPGDLQAKFYYAQALQGEGRIKQAMQVLDSLCMADPEYVAALQSLARLQAQPGFGTIHQGAAGERQIPAQAYLFALTGKALQRVTLATWSSDLWFVLQSLARNDLTQTEPVIRDVLAASQNEPLACVIHLRVLQRAADVPLQVKRKAAKHYHELWPDCLAVILLLADWSMQDGADDQAVALLHQAAAQDVGGQVARRLWDANHPYHVLWPENMQLPLRVPVPADVAAVMGWNRLPAGASVDTPAEPQPEIPSLDEILPFMIDDDELGDPAYSSEDQGLGKQSVSGESGKQLETSTSEFGLLPAIQPDSEADLTSERNEGDAQGASNRRRSQARRSKSSVASVKHFEQELERLATRLHVPGLASQDGRFPVYVIFSLRGKLRTLYGLQAETLETEIQRLVLTVRRRRHWEARLFFADDPACTDSLGLEPCNSADPWALKLALADLDQALAKRGERIGALLIVGGPDVIPFHHLPNPVDDQDADVPSDNPYATRDANYFIPEWPVGRLPGGDGDDAKLLVYSLRRIRARHVAQTQQLGRYRRWLSALWERLRPSGRRKRGSFGYTAAVWRQAADAVFRPIGRPRLLHVSPPLGLNGNGSEPQKPGAQAGRVPSPVGQLGYFNLHGLVDAPEWYGQRDPLDGSSGPDFPVALRPEDVGRGTERDAIPQVIFSEACYGLHILGRSREQAIALKFLQAGSQAVVGSTCMAYGSVGAPLTAADLLGHTFWSYLRQGLTAGEALRQAKIQMASEMHQRQGFLDGEDQKTLISFVLFGDPLAQPVRNGRKPKSVRYQTPLTEFRTVCDRRAANLAGRSTTARAVPPAEVVAAVKQTVKQYLPGMADAQMAFIAQSVGICEGEGCDCLASQLRGNCPSSTIFANRAQLPAKDAKTHVVAETNRRLVTLSKRVEQPEGMHPQIARLTLDTKGKVVKMVVSR